MYKSPLRDQPVRPSQPIRLVRSGKLVATQGHSAGDVIESSSVVNDQGRDLRAEFISSYKPPPPPSRVPVATIMSGQVHIGRQIQVQTLGYSIQH